MRLMAEKARVIAEGAGALPLAAALTGKAGDGPIVAVVSGGNIDLKKFAELIGAGARRLLGGRRVASTNSNTRQETTPPATGQPGNPPTPLPRDPPRLPPILLEVVPCLSFLDGVRLGDRFVAFGHFGEALVVDAQDFQLGLGQVFHRDEAVAGPFEGGHDLVELELNRQCVPTVLGVLNEEDHQKRDDRGAGIDDELPRVGVVKDRSGGGPQDDDVAAVTNAPVDPVQFVAAVAKRDRMLPLAFCLRSDMGTSRQTCSRRVPARLECAAMVRS